MSNACRKWQKDNKKELLSSVLQTKPHTIIKAHWNSVLTIDIFRMTLEADVIPTT